MASRFWKELQRRLEWQDPQQAARWTGIVASTWVSSTLGIGYSFGLYSPMLKQFLGYSQAQLNTLAFATDVGGNVGIMAGMAVDVFPVWGLLLIGSLESLLGHGAIWLVLRGFVGPFSFWQVLYLSLSLFLSRALEHTETRKTVTYMRASLFYSPLF